MSSPGLFGTQPWSAVAANARGPSTISEGEAMNMGPEAVLKKWMTGVNEGDLDAVLNLYSDGATLVPTFSSRVMDSNEKIKKYFELLTSRDDLSVALHEKTVNIQTVRDPIHLITGVYCWRFAVDGEILSFEARFTFMVDLDRPNPIIHHHSSQIPRTL